MRPLSIGDGFLFLTSLSLSRSPSGDGGDHRRTQRQTATSSGGWGAFFPADLMLTLIPSRVNSKVASFDWFSTLVRLFSASMFLGLYGSCVPPFLPLPLWTSQPIGMGLTSTESSRILQDIETLKSAKSDLERRISALESQLRDLNHHQNDGVSNGSCTSLSTVESGFPHGLSPDMIYRYSRHLLLPSFGVQGPLSVWIRSFLIQIL